nr:S protein [Bat coronavirus]
MILSLLLLVIAVCVNNNYAWLGLQRNAIPPSNQDGECGGDPGKLPNLNLGLPPNKTVFVSGYLPLHKGWVCPTHPLGGGGYGTTFNDIHAIYWSYHSTANAVELAVSSGNGSVTRDWSLYVHHSNNQGYMYFKICRWGAVYPLNLSPNHNRGDCLVNRKFNFRFLHGANQVLGVTWSSNYVTLYGLNNTYRFYLHNNWERATVRCHTKQSCAFFPVENVTTLNITTNGEGLIESYDVCADCGGFPVHVFPVLEHGYIPNDFSFSNWFMLSNTSTFLQGKLVSTQPLKLMCLWPVPSLLANDEKIFFNASGATCNGYQFDGVADAIRFSLNFSSDQVFNGVNNIVFDVEGGTFEFFCTNDTSVNPTYRYVPFGQLTEIYRCFVETTAENGTHTTFVGILPPVVREIVVSRLGAIYINGYRLISLPVIESIVFNVTSKVGSDFWTVAFAQDVEVLLELNATNIVDILYCESPINKLKCQQLTFSLDDGFYPASSAYTEYTPRSYVALPYHATHTEVVLGVHLSLYTKHSATLNGGNDTICVNTTQFTTVLNASVYTGARGDVVNVNCPFTWASLNDYLSFGTICFSFEPLPGGCTMSINVVNLGYYTPFATLYVGYTRGHGITGVSQKVGGIFDPSFITLDTCTEYTVYGITGKGVITSLNKTIVAGLYYTSTSGQLLGFKNSTTGEVFAVRPCDLASQVAVYQNDIIGAMTASRNSSFGFANVSELSNFYYHSNGHLGCEEPVLIYGKMGICSDGSLTEVNNKDAEQQPVSPIATANVTVPVNFTVSVQVEYLQMYMQPVSVDCNTYVCSGNVHCLRLLTQYASACRNIESSLQLSARLESLEVNSAITVSERAASLANITNFENYNLSVLLPNLNGRSAMEDLLFNKVVTNGLGTVDQDYKQCIKDKGVGDVADVACAQYYNGVMVLPGVVDDTKMSLYTASLVGGMVLAGFTAGAAIPFSLAVQARLNYVALQTDVLQRNQQILAESFNSALSNITEAFTEVNEAIKNTADAINTVATALGKVQSVVNQQGEALAQLTKQLSSNFQAISSSIEDIYLRLDKLAADAQVDRLISGRLAGLNAFVTQTLTKYTEVRASRQLALQKVNECVKSQSSRYGFCGNGTHLFSVVNAAPNGIMFFHTVLIPSSYTTVQAWAGVCVNGDVGLILRDVRNTLFYLDSKYYITTRDMYQPRTPVQSDFVRISNCSVSYVNITSEQLGDIIPDYLDVNKTLNDLQQSRPNYTVPDLGLDQYNTTILNLTSEIAMLQNKSDSLIESTVKLHKLIEQLNQTYVDLEWLNRLESYVKWPWWVWLAILLALIFTSFILLYCCCSTGCCGCTSCLADCRGQRLQRYEVEKVHIQ